MAVSNVELRVDSRQAVNALRDVNRASAQTESGIGKLQSTIGKLAGSFAAIQAAKFIFAKTAEIESQTRSLQVLTGSVQQAKQIIQELQQLGAVTPFTSTELIDAAKRLQAFGVAAGDVVETTRRLADASGATGAELQGLVTAYGQVQAKGRLQGEELLQFQERGIALQEELRKMYGMTGEEFQKALSKGQISAKAVEVALQRLTSAGGKYANGAIAQSDTLSGKLSTLQDGVDAIARRIGQVLTPALKAIFNQAIAVVDAINAALAAGRGGGFTRNVAGARQFLNIGATSQAVDNIAKGVSQVGSQRNKTGIQQNLQALQQYQRLLQSVGPNDPNANRAVQLQGVILGKIQENVAAQKQLNQQSTKAGNIFDVPALAAATGGGKKKKGKTDAERAAEAAAKEADRVAQVIRERLAEGQILQLKSNIQDKIAAAEAAGDKQLAVRLKGQEKELDIQYRYAQALAQEKDIRAQEAIIYEGNTALVANQREIQRELTELQNESARNQIAALENQISLQAELTEGQKQQKAVADSLAGTIGEGLTSSFNALIQGSEDFGSSLRRIASGVLIDIANQLLRVFVIQKAINALSGLFGGGGAGGLSYSGVTGSALGTSMLSGNFTATPFSTIGLGFRANGGSVRAGSPYVVGERGPELFMPGRSGGIARTGSFGGAVSVVVNVDAGGTSVEGNEPNANQLGRIVGAAVQAEIVKQQRPGGLLANTR
jgi:tape measure domain-containing protein